MYINGTSAPENEGILSFKAIIYMYVYKHLNYKKIFFNSFSLFSMYMYFNPPPFFLKLFLKQILDIKNEYQLICLDTKTNFSY